VDISEPTSASPPAPSNRVQTSLVAHVLCYGLLAIALVWGLYSQWHRSETLSAGSRPAPARISEIQTRIDPNVADWPELVRLPGIGETLAKRIVAYRRQQAAGTGQGPVYRSLEDLDAVRGIGPKTLAKIAEYLSFPVPGEENLAETPGSGDVDRSAQSALE
jgi:DNA uptake protein ComE-like DNA-binding protein